MRLVWARLWTGHRPRIRRAASAPRGVRGRSAAAEKGLTTLEWLLVVAAVAGLAALAVVLVQNVASDTARETASRNARQTAADLAATQLARQWQAERPDTKPEEDRINRRYAAKCRQLGVIYNADISPKRIESYNGTHDPNGGWAGAALPSCHVA